jgi:energy-coupling factor transporter ATP-binding protein EcfA2
VSNPPAELQVRDLSFRYPAYEGLENRDLLDGLSFELPRGRITVLLGLPDSGKTTLGRIITGLVPRFTGGELQGEVCLGEERLTGRPTYELGEQVGLVFQNPGEQLLASRCDSEVAFALESLGVEHLEMRERVQRALGRLGLWPFRERDPQTLSGGEKKKLLLACLLAVDPQVWVLDETLEELDQDSQRGLFGLLREKGRTGLILSAKWHSVFAEFAHRVCLLEEGKVGILDPGGRGVEPRVLTEKGFTLAEESDRPAESPAGNGSRRAESGEMILEANDLEFSYPDGSREDEPFRLRIPEFHLRAGETVALVGDNGSGKTTLARLLAGLLVPQRGTIRARGAVATPEELNCSTAYVFQDPDLQIFLPTVAEELSYGLALHGHAPEQIQREVADAVSRFALPGEQAPAALMSYGARKRLQAAVYYLLKRRLVIIDEGDSGLGVRDFVKIVRELSSPATAVLIITHDLRLARVLAGRTIRLQKGRPV